MHCLLGYSYTENYSRECFKKRQGKPPKSPLLAGSFSTSATIVPDQAANHCYILLKFRTYDKERWVAYFFIAAVPDIESSASTPTALNAAHVIVLIDGYNGRIRNAFGTSESLFSASLKASDRAL